MSKNEYVCDCNMVHKEMVEDTLSKMPEDAKLNNLADFFKIMGDSTRCKLLFALLQNEMCVCDLANVLSMTIHSLNHKHTFHFATKQIAVCILLSHPLS